VTLLYTLDFPPERGGIQRYLFDRAVHRLGPGDCVVVGQGKHSPMDAGSLSCRVIRLYNPLSGFNKKWSLINLFIHATFHCGSGETAVECGNVYAAVAVWLASFIRTIRYRVYTYGGELAGLRKRNLKSALLTSVLRRSEALYTLGAFSGNLIGLAGVDRPIEVEPPRIMMPRDAGIRPSRSIEEFSQKIPIRMLSVGRFVQHKGHAILLEACRRISSEIPWHLTLIGVGPLEKQLAYLIGKYGQTEKVALRAGINDDELYGEYRRADLFILPSLELPGAAEGFGIVLLEAMAFGVPIVASSTGGITEVLDNGVCGFLVEPGDAAALAAGIEAMARDKILRQRFAQRAFERLRERYVWH
jgi:glycosyltransferase involved in cell wall biosynthesis